MPLPTRPRREDAPEHSKITFHKAASYPPLQRTQGRGTQCLGDAGEIKSPGHPPLHVAWCQGLCVKAKAAGRSARSTQTWGLHDY